MLKRSGRHLASVMLLTVLAGVGATNEVGLPAKPIRPYVAFSGADTRIAGHEQHRITSFEEWEQLWLRHTGQSGKPSDYDRVRHSGAPAIDFDRCMVIAVIESPGRQNAGLVVVRIREYPDRLVFDYRDSFYPISAEASAPGNAFGYFVVPRSAKPLDVRRAEDVDASTVADTKWKVLKRFPVLERPPRSEQPTALNMVFAHDPGRGEYDGIVGEPHDAWNFVDAGVTQVKGLVMPNGERSAVELRVSPNDGKWGISEHSGVFHGYVYHNCQCVDLSASLVGMPPGRYRAFVFAHGDAPNQNAEIELKIGEEVVDRKATSNDGTWRFRSHDYREGLQYVSFEFCLAARTTVDFTARRSGSRYSMLNAIQIVPWDE